MKQALKWIIVAVFTVVFLLLVYGVAIEPRLILDTENEIASIRNLPPGWEGEVVAVIGDLQVGMWLDNTGMVERVVEELVEVQPSVVLLLGDYVYHPIPNPENETEKVVELLRPIPESGIPTLAVLGNHDYAVSGKDQEPVEAVAQQVAAELEAIGIHVLENEAVTLPAPQSSGEDQLLYFVGLGSYYIDNARPEVALAQVPEAAPRFVYFSHPDTFALLPPDSAPVSVAGHTHGGQIRIPGLPQWSWLTYVEEETVHSDGWISDQDFGAPGNRLYVNRGIGFSIVPIRINAPPEITYFMLARK